MKDMMDMMKKAQEMQAKMQEAQDSLADVTVEGTAGGGAVTVTFNGRGEAKGVKIDPELLNPDEAEILEDLVVAAITAARKKAEAEGQRVMKDAMGGFGGMPGMGGLGNLFGGGKGEL